ncbi:flagellar motor protein MotB [Desulfovibrio sp. OttesenSCG-928-F07]|nr:flagellar motor protein MotB [Desulfovibrio sp. OttesenSCG-928-F07]
MAKKRQFSTPVQQPWLITFSDLMTLMLTFFVILVAMSVIDENSRQRVVESVRHVFGFEEHKFLLERDADAIGMVRPGVSQRENATPHEAAQLVDSDNPNASVRYTDTEVIISLQGDLLFAEGGVSLGLAGQRALDKLLPALHGLEYPVLIAGYSAPGIAEGSHTGVSEERAADSSWQLSAERSLAVYKYFIERGINADMLRMEAYGSFRPRFSNNSTDGRRKNRRVELVLDKRNPGIRAGFESLLPTPGQGQEFFFREFRFNLDAPLPESSEAATGGGI